MMQSSLFLCLAAAVVAPSSGAEWPAAVPGHVAVEAGEHPRLFFRKADLPALKQRAATKEGQEIVARLKFMLGGGKAMPASISQLEGDVGGTPGDLQKWPPGSFTMTHAAGFGFLHQLTGDRKYAELSRQCLDLMFKGTRDTDNRYAFRKPASTMRGGFGLMGVAMAYDFCYDAWDDVYRRQIVRELLTYREESVKRTSHKISDIREYCLKPNMPPTSNHFGAQIGGAGIAVLAVMGDPGADPKVVGEYLRGIQSQIARLLTEGHGDTGYFFEGMGPGQISTDVTFVPLLGAMRTAAGLDYAAHPTTKWLALQWAQLMLPRNGHPFFANPRPAADYGTDEFSRGNRPTHGPSHSGRFAQGFMLLDDAQRAALLWTYRTQVEPDEAKTYKRLLPNGGKSYDVLEYGHRAIFALLHWPIGVEPRNPDTVLPRATGDRTMGWHVFRSRWQDEDDIIVGVLLGARNSAPTLLWGLKERLRLPELKRGKAAFWRPAEDGSGVLVSGDTAIAVDFSKASGADALIVMVGTRELPTQGKAKATTISAGNTRYHVPTLAAGEHPQPKAEGPGITVGRQTVVWDGGRLVLGAMAGLPKLKQ